MSSPNTAKPLVLVVGGAGNTGRVLVNTFLELGTFRVAVLTRTASELRPAVTALKSKGVDIRLGDFASDPIEQLAGVVAGVDILISTVTAEVVLNQKNIFEAAAKAGVKRIIPSDLGTACPPGVRDLHDQKLAIRAFVRELGVPYTFVDVGCPAGWFAEISHEFFGPGTVEFAVTDLKDISLLVARIIEDPRTINQYVFCWGEHVTMNGVYEIAERVSGQKLNDIKVLLSDGECLRRAAAGRNEYKKKANAQAYANWAHYQYVLSIYIRGDNTLGKAKADGALDVRELYPDYKPRTLEEYAKEFYATVVPESSDLKK